MNSGSGFDVGIIGGGILGLATGKALSSRFVGSLVVLEAEPELACHQTGHNSGVIHSGLYYTPGSLKARLCTDGREALYRFCQEYEIPHVQCGKLVVASDQLQRPILEDLERRGRENGLQGLRRLSLDEMREREPHIAGVEGLFVPQTGIVDFRTVAWKLADLIRQAGHAVRTGAQVYAVDRQRTRFRLETTAGSFACAHLINCGGLHADRIARMCGLDPRIRIVPFRGEYYELMQDRRHLIRHLIYPVPDPELPFLGVHFTRTIHGKVEAGPNAVLALSRRGYTRWRISPRDVVEYLGYDGFRRMIRKRWRAGLAELQRSMRKRAFVAELKRLVPEIEPRDLRRGNAGVRAQAVAPDGSLVDDFRVLDSERMVHVLNAPSPAATASLSIGRYIAELAGRRFRLEVRGRAGAER